MLQGHYVLTVRCEVCRKAARYETAQSRSAAVRIAKKDEWRVWRAEVADHAFCGDHRMEYYRDAGMESGDG